jgi:S1-C subfamily serine protease
MAVHPVREAPGRAQAGNGAGNGDAARFDSLEGWQFTPFGKLQAVPRDGRPVTKWKNRDEAFADVARSIRAAAMRLDAETSVSSSLTDSKLQVPDWWKGPPTDYVGVERIIGDQSPLLPISFLEIGLERARAVARIVCPDGVGTGFLIRDNLLITNNHVISKPEEAREARIQMGFR